MMPSPKINLRIFLTFSNDKLTIYICQYFFELFKQGIVEINTDELI